MEPYELIKFLEGRWLLERGVTSSNGLENLRAKGESRLIQENKNLLVYQEALEVQTNTKTLDSSRTYYYEYDPQRGKCFKYFDDRRLFYELMFKNGIISGYHQCIDDAYKAKYIIENELCFILEYKVLGPKKNYLIENVYSRLL